MLFADDTSIGAVGGVLGAVSAALTALGGLYVLYDRHKTRQEQSREKAAALQKTEVEVQGLATQKVAEAYDRFAAERRAAHERDVAFLTAEISAAHKRLSELEARESECQNTCRELRGQNAAQAREMVELHRKIDHLEQELRGVTARPK